MRLSLLKCMYVCTAFLRQQHRADAVWGNISGSGYETRVMLRRGRVRPEIDPYIRLRYQDTAIWIHNELKEGRGMHSYYASWLESMIQTLSPESREKYTLMGAVKLPPIHDAVTAEQALPTDYQARANTWQNLELKTQHSKFCIIL